MKIDKQRVNGELRRRGWSKRELANRMRLIRPGLSEATVYNGINQRTEPDGSLVEAMATVFDWTVAYLVGESDNPAGDSFSVDPVWLDLTRRFENLPPVERQKLTAIMEGIMDLLTPKTEGQHQEDAVLIADIERLRWVRAGLSPAQRAQMEAEILALAQRYAVEHGSTAKEPAGESQAVNG